MEIKSGRLELKSGDKSGCQVDKGYVNSLSTGQIVESPRDPGSREGYLD